MEPSHEKCNLLYQRSIVPLLPTKTSLLEGKASSGLNFDDEQLMHVGILSHWVIVRWKEITLHTGRVESQFLTNPKARLF
jgi:hypothetical protein